MVFVATLISLPFGDRETALSILFSKPSGAIEGNRDAKRECEHLTTSCMTTHIPIAFCAWVGGSSTQHNTTKTYKLPHGTQLPRDPRDEGADPHHTIRKNHF